MALEFKDKVVVITGSGSGIGRATAREFCRQGANVMLNGRSPDKLQTLQEELTAAGYEVNYFAGDVTSESACKALCEFTIACYGKVDVLITNASVSMNARFDEMAPAFFKLITDSTIHGSALPAFAFLPEIKRQNGSVVFIGSLAGIHGMPRASAYSVGKMGLIALQQTLEIELKGSGVHIGIVELGFTENDSDKLLVSANGQWEPVPDRISILRQSQEKVATSIFRAVKYRERRKTLSGAGILLKGLAIFSPPLLRLILARGR